MVTVPNAAEPPTAFRNRWGVDLSSLLVTVISEMDGILASRLPPPVGDEMPRPMPHCRESRLIHSACFASVESPLISPILMKVLNAALACCATSRTAGGTRASVRESGEGRVWFTMSELREIPRRRSMSFVPSIPCLQHAHHVELRDHAADEGE